MIKQLILTTSVAVLLHPVLALAQETPIAAQPMTVETSIGNEQSDFFLSRDKKDNYKITFSSNVKTLTNKKGAFDQRTMFGQKIGSIGGNGIETSFQVDKATPLSKLTTFSIPNGEMLDTFLFNPNSENDQTVQGLPQWFFHVPTHGVYFATGGGAPALVKAVTGDFSGMALHNPGFTANDTNHIDAFRVVLDATDKKHGDEPYISQGPAGTTALMQDIEQGANRSNPRSFVTALALETSIQSAYFVADGPDGTTVYETAVNTSNPHKATYNAAVVDSGVDPTTTLHSSNGILFATAPDISDVNQLYYRDDNDQFQEVTGAGNSPEDFTPQVPQENSILDGTGFSSVDGSGNRRFSVFSESSGAAYFSDDTGDFTNPTDVTCTGNEFYYNADWSEGGNWFMQDFNGGTDNQDFVKDSDDFFLTNARELCFVHDDNADGVLYFVADESGGLSDLLFMIDPNAGGLPVAEKVTTVNNNVVVGAHNLRPIVDTSLGVFRLYFTAPINSSQNAEYLSLAPVPKHGSAPTDLGTKPFVTNEQPQ